MAIFHSYVRLRGYAGIIKGILWDYKWGFQEYARTIDYTVDLWLRLMLIYTRMERSLIMETCWDFMGNGFNGIEWAFEMLGYNEPAMISIMGCTGISMGTLW